MKTCSQCQVKYPDVLEFCPRDGSPLPATHSGSAAAYDPLIGTTIDGRYAIEAGLGEGGMGVVYKARHVLIDKPVAIKILRKEAAQDAASVQRFIQEAKSASKINHSNIVDITDFGVLSDGHAYFVMEFLQGQTLAQAIQEGPLGPARVCLIGAQMARGLYAAHTKGIVHRDLKPENIFLLEREGHRDFVKIVDFGIAKVGSGQRLTQVGMVLGTPEYMSPEQATGQETDARVDQYALGCMMYEMLTGTVPFLGERPAQTLTKHVFEPVIPPAKRKPELNIPPPLEAVVLRTLGKKPAERYPSMRELELALMQVGDELRQGRTDDSRYFASRPGIFMGGDGSGLNNAPATMPVGNQTSSPGQQAYAAGSLQPATMGLLPPQVSGALQAYAPSAPSYIPPAGSNPFNAASPQQPGPGGLAYGPGMPGYHPSLISFPGGSVSAYQGTSPSAGESRPTRESLPAQRDRKVRSFLAAAAGAVLFMAGSFVAYSLLSGPKPLPHPVEIPRPVEPIHEVQPPPLPPPEVKQVVPPVTPLPPEVRPPLPQKVLVHIRAYPENALVEVDGRRCGRPCEASLFRDATFHLRIHKKGYDDYEKELPVDRDPPDLTVELTRIDRQHGVHKKVPRQPEGPPPSLKLPQVPPSSKELRNPFGKSQTDTGAEPKGP